MVVERSGIAVPVALARALETLPKISGTEPISGIVVPNERVNGVLLREAVLLTARDVGANYLTGDPSASRVQLTQVEAGGIVDTVLTVDRTNGQEVDTQQLLITEGRVLRIKEVPGVSYSEVPAGGYDHDVARRVLTNIAVLQ